MATKFVNDYPGLPMLPITFTYKDIFIKRVINKFVGNLPGNVGNQGNALKTLGNPFGHESRGMRRAVGNVGNAKRKNPRWRTEGFLDALSKRLLYGAFSSAY